MNPPVDLSSFHLLHDVFRIRAKDPVQIPLLAFPAHVDADFEYFTGKDLDRFTDKAAWYYSKAIRALVGWTPSLSCSSLCVEIRRTYLEMLPLLNDLRS